MCLRNKSCLLVNQYYPNIFSVSGEKAIFAGNCKVQYCLHGVGTKPGVGHGLGHGVGHGVSHGLPVVNKVKKNNKKIDRN